MISITKLVNTSSITSQNYQFLLEKSDTQHCVNLRCTARYFDIFVYMNTSQCNDIYHITCL